MTTDHFDLIDEKRKKLLTQNYLNLGKEIKSYSERCSRAVPKLVVVSKTYPVEEISFVSSLGQIDFAENRVDELISKDQSLESTSPVCFHFIGHLQSNKVNKLLEVQRLKYIHSIDSFSLYEKIFTKWQQKRDLYFFIQVNTSLEDEKHGILEEQEIYAILDHFQKSASNFKCIGLMTMGPIRVSDVLLGARNSFEKLVGLKQKLQERYSKLSPLQLSMGMSSDYLIAIECGGDYLRIGSKIFA